MHYGFWEKLPRPFFVLAPMANVTDTVFRQIIVAHSRPDVLFTEFVSCDGLMSRGYDALIRDLSYAPVERPIVAQVFGATPKNFYGTGKLVAELGFDGLDINMGCPDKAVVKQGAGAGLIKTPSLALELIAAAREGTKAGGRELPISVKTRLGGSVDEADRWIPQLLSATIPALTVHCRTRKEMSKVPAHWERMKDIVAMAAGIGTIIVGNGDVLSVADGRAKAEASGVDGLMLGRAIFGNPWLFRDGYAPSVRERLTVMVEHTRLFASTWGDTKNFETMKKHYKAYANGFPGAHELRAELMTLHDAEAVATTVERFLAGVAA